MIGNSSQTNLLSKLLQQAEVRQQVISQNIANLNTPDYQTLEVTFEEVASTQGTEQQLNPKSILVDQAYGLVEREDGNNVDLDRELGNLTKNSMEFETYSHLLLAKFSLFRSAITGQ